MASKLYIESLDFETKAIFDIYLSKNTIEKDNKME